MIDVADAVSGFIAGVFGLAPGELLRSSIGTLLTAVTAGSVGMALLLAFLYLLYGFFVLYVLVQMLVRLALIDLLLALAPIALGLWILPHTAGWGRHWLKLFMTTVFQQAVQLIALALAFGFLADFADIGAFEPVQDLVWKLLISLAFVYLTTRVPSLMGNPGTFDAWLHTLYFGMSLPGSIVRSARSIGTVAGGLTGGGPAGAGCGGGRCRHGHSCGCRRGRSGRWRTFPPLHTTRPAERLPPGARANEGGRLHGRVRDPWRRRGAVTDVRIDGQ